MDTYFDNPLFIIPAITGIIFIITGIIMLKFPPKQINALYGYRTPNSMKNQQRWDFAQKYAAIEMMKLGGVLSLCSLLGFIYNPHGATALFIGLVFVILTVV